MFRKILIACRGIIAVRVIRACRELGIQTVAVYSDIDKDSLHVQLADESICIGPKEASASYLNMTRILSAALITGAEAIYPGYGFLSESSRFALLCEKSNLVFIGPLAQTIEKMGDKVQARKAVTESNIPVVPGTLEPIINVEEGLRVSRDIGFPILIKASGGGGGKGLRIVEQESDFIRLFESAQFEAKKAFNNDEMYLERYIQHARHIEFQILADNYGNVVHLGERDCSMQRRYQKVLEEAPSSVINTNLRNKMGDIAVRIGKIVNYRNAGTVEFILDDENNYYFIEMNTRVQVEHAVTEMLTDIDIVKEQIKVAAGEPLSFTQKDVQIKGHVIECRIIAEDTTKNFMPSPGKINFIHIPGGNGIRVDTALYEGCEILPVYDSHIANLIVYDKNRELAIMKMLSALGEFVIEGVATNLDFQYSLLNDKSFHTGEFNTNYIESRMKKNA